MDLQAKKEARQTRLEAKRSAQNVAVADNTPEAAADEGKK